MADYNSSFTGQQIDSAVDQVVNKKIPADGVKFSDGETFQQKLDQGDLNGPAGQNGKDGAPGSNGADGRPGTDGKSAYASAMDGGYVGTESQFNQDLAKVGQKVDKATPSADGNFAALGSDGNLKDSGKSSASFDAAGAANAVQQNLTSHANNKSNPHGVTAEQVGAATTQYVDGKIKYGTTDPGVGSSLTTGTIYAVYE